jgi:uncharacterized damage-inducible protein DinB
MKWNKLALLDRLRSSGLDAVARLRAIPVSDFEEGRYENGWNGRQILAHIASVEWTYPLLIDLAKAGGSVPEPTADQASRINDYNERHVAKRAGASVDELLAEFERNRAALVKALAAADDKLLDVYVETFGGTIKGPLAEALLYVADEHVMHHIDDIAGG